MIRIREVTEEDVEKIVELQVEFREESKEYDIFLEPGDNYPQKQLERTRKILSKESFFYIAEEDGNAIGLLFGRVKKKPTLKVNSIGHIHEIFVLEKYRGKGAGKALMEKFVEKMKELGVSYVDLGVYVKNKEAIDFYNKSEFEEYKKYLRKKI